MTAETPTTDERVMLITGARKGLGRGLAERYLLAGWRVVGCSRGESDLRHVRYRHVQADVGDERSAAALFREIAGREGRLDALINNAGVASMNHVLLTPLASAERIVRTNQLGTFLFCREAAKLMQRRKSGRIVNFTSVAAPLDLEGEAVYASSKAAVESLTRILSREFAAFGITVNAVGPNPIDTDLTRAIPEDKMSALLARQAIPRKGELADVVHAVNCFLAPEAGLLTGQVLYLGGVA